MSEDLFDLIRQRFEMTNFAHLAERYWFSSGVAGRILSFTVRLSGAAHDADAERLEQEIGEIDFSDLDKIVADIAVVHRLRKECESQLWIDALLVED
jgi:hypothetical protein